MTDKATLEPAPEGVREEPINATKAGLVNLAQLAAELDTQHLSMLTQDGVTTVHCFDEATDQAALDAAVAAHEPAPPPPSTPSLLQAQVDDLTDLILEL